MCALDEADCDRVAAFGLYFGGLCVLDLARSGTKDLHDAISVYGVLTGPDLPTSSITARLLLLHGWEDPVAPPQDVVALGEELNAAKAQWEMRIFGDAMHAFTLEEADMEANGILNNSRAVSEQSKSGREGAKDAIDIASRHI
ncbi:MAG: dienelactone hydrolase family protein [Pseudomonadota bacterium]